MPAPDLIYLPEADFAPDKFLSDVEGKLKEKNTVIVAVSEGIRSSDGKYICDSVLPARSTISATNIYPARARSWRIW